MNHRRGRPIGSCSLRCHRPLLVARRVELSVTRGQVAASMKALGCSTDENTIFEWEMSSTLPSRTHQLALCRVLRVSMRWLEGVLGIDDPVAENVALKQLR